MSEFRVLFVCTGNLCRSPIGEALLAGYADPDRVTVSSAGTHAHPGTRIDSLAAAVLRERNHPADAHRATRLTSALVESAQLVLTATVDHRRLVLSEQPGAFRRTFSLREFARLGAGLDPAGPDLRARVAEVAAQRGVVDPGPDDIADPYGARIETMRACANQVDEAVLRVVDILGLGRPVHLLAPAVEAERLPLPA